MAIFVAKQKKKSEAELQREEQRAMKAKPAGGTITGSASTGYTRSTRAWSAKPTGSVYSPSKTGSVYNPPKSTSAPSYTGQSGGLDDIFLDMSETNALRLEQRVIRDVNAQLKNNPNMTATADTYREALVWAAG